MLAVTNNWVIHQIVVSNAFLHGNLDERIVVAQRPSFIDQSNPDYVCLLQKSLYGLKQSPRCWFRRLREALNALGLIESRMDSSVFLSKQGSYPLYLCLYVDDIVITSSSTIEISRILHLLATDFPITDLGELKFFLSVEVNRVKEGLHLSQARYLANLLQTCNLDNIKPTVTPMVPNVDLNATSEPFQDLKEYRRVVGSLQYATLTCRTFSLQSTDCHSICVSQPCNIGLLLNAFCVSSQVQSRMESSFV